jgi:hypothetical protein
MRRKSKLAVAMTAACVAAAGGIGAGAAQAQDKLLQASATTFQAGSSGYCFKGSARATFTASGPATGSYAGTFTEVAANVLVSSPTYAYTSTTLTLSITIVSGSTTINGTITNPPPYSGGTLSCFGGSFFTAGLIANANAATYTATIQSPGQLAQTVSATAQASAAFQSRPYQILGTPPTVTLLNFPSP